MKRLAILALAIAALPASAQTTNTQCRWIGNIWSCDSQTKQKPTTPLDQGAILRSGAAIVPPYEPNQTPDPLPVAPPAVDIEHRYGLTVEQTALVRNLLKNCPEDDYSAIKFNRIEEESRALVATLCYAFDQGESKGFGRGYDRGSKQP